MRFGNFILALAIVAFSAFAMRHFWKGTVLTQDQVARRWGKTEFDASHFKAGNEIVRASMAYSILKNEKKFRGKFVVDLRAELGAPDGFYFSDIFPAYMISRARKDNEESWQIVFLLNNQRRVENIIVHKNCCD